MGCGFKEWFDPSMCPQPKKIIPGLLRSINRKYEEIKKLNAMVMGSQELVIMVKEEALGVRLSVLC